MAWEAFGDVLERTISEEQMEQALTRVREKLEKLGRDARRRVEGAEALAAD
jgi:hypothetical protein